MQLAFPTTGFENELELGRYEGLVDHTKNTSTGTRQWHLVDEPRSDGVRFEVKNNNPTCS